jgi:hypothetical protein
MAIAFREDDPGLEDELSDEELDMEIFGAYAEIPEAGGAASNELTAAGAADYAYPDDELINQEDPYLQDLLGAGEEE